MYNIYPEPHYQYIVESCYNFKPGSEHYEALVAEGIDPENNWSLRWSFLNAHDALAQLEEDKEWNALTKFRVRDSETGEVLAVS